MLSSQAGSEVWAEADGSGLTFDSSTCYSLPNGADRSPDAAWILLLRWSALKPEQRRRFPTIAPDFVVELRCDTDSLLCHSSPDARVY